LADGIRFIIIANKYKIIPSDMAYKGIFSAKLLGGIDEDTGHRADDLIAAFKNRICRYRL